MGQSVDVKVVGNYAYFSYDSFGVVCYSMADLIAPLPEGIEPTEVWNKDTAGNLVYDYRPVAVSRFKLQLVPGYEDWAGGAVQNGLHPCQRQSHFLRGLCRGRRC